jgi:hypothetical protein
VPKVTQRVILSVVQGVPPKALQRVSVYLLVRSTSMSCPSNVHVRPYTRADSSMQYIPGVNDPSMTPTGAYILQLLYSLAIHTDDLKDSPKDCQ